MKRQLSIIICLAVVFLCLSSNSYAQYYFGQNKIQYSQFDWQVLTTEHFKIYFYPEEKDVAETAAEYAEESYTYLQTKFNHTIDKKIPLIIYSSPVFFEQTNVVPDILPENVAGFTEYFKQRVVIPFNGSYSEFAHVIRHELVHVFTFEKITYVAKMRRHRNIADPPLWFTEGIAEYWSAGWDRQADMIIRDMVISGKIITTNNIYEISGTFLMYKVGQSILKYMGDKYGDDKLSDLFDNWWKSQDFNEIVKVTYGKRLSEISDEWEYSLKKQYYPYMTNQELPDRKTEKLTQKGFNVKPTIFLKSTKNGLKEFIAFKTFRMGYSNIAEMPLDGEGAGFHTLIKGGRSEKFESLHFIDTGLDANKDGLITFVSKNRETDVLYVYDTKEKDVISEIKNDSLVVITSPSWSPDGVKIVFEGVARGGHSDLYIYNTHSGSFDRLTNDVYVDKTPVYCGSDSIIVFSSDRSGDGSKGTRNLFMYNLKSNAISQLTFGNQIDESPRFVNSKGKLVYTSDRNGCSNIYMLDNPFGTNHEITQLTNFVTGAFDPVMAENDSTVIFTAYQDFSFQIYKMKIPETPIAVYSDTISSTGVNTLASNWAPPRLKGQLSQGSVKYQTKLSFDIAQSAVAYDAVAGPMGGLQFALTDMLGNHQYYFLLYNTANTKDQFLKSFNAAATYLNKTRRFNWGGGIFHFYEEYNDDYYGYVAERNYGGVLLGSYPISRYRRLESAIYIRRLEKNVLTGDGPKATLGSVTLSYIKDTSIWDPTGPIDGTRFNISMSQAFDIDKAKYFNSSYNLDFRKYFRISQYSAFASRIMLYHSAGQDPQRYYLGGSWSLRGYPRRYFFGRNLALINNELRFPLINDLLINFPIGSMRFQAIRGAFFLDAGNAWEKDYHGLFGSFGFGLRVALGYVTVLRFDFSRRTDFRTATSNKYDFDFFFGWNF